MLLFSRAKKQHHGGVIKRAVKEWARRRKLVKKLAEGNGASKRLAQLLVIESLDVPAERKNHFMQITRQTVRLDELVEVSRASRSLHKPQLTRILKQSKAEAFVLLKILDLAHDSKLIAECRAVRNDVDEQIEKMHRHAKDSAFVNPLVAYRLRRVHEAYATHEFGEHYDTVTDRVRKARQGMHRL